MPYQKALFAVFLCAVFSPVTAVAQKDIVCQSNNVRTERPGECAAHCSAEMVHESCALDPKLPALNDVPFKTFYNAAFFDEHSRARTASCNLKSVDQLLGTYVPVRPQQQRTSVDKIGLDKISLNKGSASPQIELRDKIIQRAVMAWFGGSDVDEIKIIWGRDELPNTGTALVPNGQGSYSLFVSVNLLCKTPALLVASIGHEMLHLEQDNRKYHTLNIDDLDIRKVRDAMRDVEAYAWETNEGYFTWKFSRQNQWLAGFAPSEEADLKTLAACSRWNLEHEIEEVRSSPKNAEALKKLSLYFNEDPWVRNSWLPGHGDWAYRNAVPQPASCSKLPFAAY